MTPRDTRDSGNSAKGGPEAGGGGGEAAASLIGATPCRFDEPARPLMSEPSITTCRSLRSYRHSADNKGIFESISLLMLLLLQLHSPRMRESRNRGVNRIAR